MNNVDNSLVEVLTLKTVQDISRVRFGQDFEVEAWDFEAEVWSTFWSWCLVKILRQKFGQYFVVKDWPTFWARSLVKILMLNFDQLATWLKNSYFVESNIVGNIFTYPLLAISTEFDLFKTIFPIFTHFHFLRGRLTWHIGCCNIKHQAMHTFLSFCWFCNCLQLLFPVAVAPSQCHPSWNIATSMSLSSFLLF